MSFLTCSKMINLSLWRNILVGRSRSVPTVRDSCAKRMGAGIGVCRIGSELREHPAKMDMIDRYIVNLFRYIDIGRACWLHWIECTLSFVEGFIGWYLFAYRIVAVINSIAIPESAIIIGAITGYCCWAIFVVGRHFGIIRNNDHVSGNESCGC